MNRQGLLIGVAVVGAVLIGVGLWSVFRGNDTGDTVTPITGPERAEEARNIIADIQRRTETQPRPATPPPATAPAGQGQETPPASPGDAPAGAAEPVRPDVPVNELDKAFAEAEAFRNAGQLADAQLLYFFAARQGHGRAAFEYAAIHDPLHFVPEQSLLDDPDPFQAFRWYSTARDAGIAEAADRLDALRKWATDAAANGDAEAERLLLQWR